uniref:G_PROTEIN_RECEP_F1_2 domain-containing protein n=1 Tax=Panagrellus redivivus TaxID=6233 RepID=A0A7E4VDB7_PANRE
MVELIAVMAPIALVFTVFTLVLELLSVIFYTVQFVKKHHFISSPYFYIMTIYLVIHAITNLSYLISDPFDAASVPRQIDNVIQWYGYLIMGPLNVLLTVNRFTAVVFYQRFTRIWRLRHTILCIFVTLLFPFAIDGHAMLNIDCFLQTRNPGCAEEGMQMGVIQVYTQITCCVISIVLTVCSIIAARVNRVLYGSSVAVNLERRLLFQSSVSTFLFSFTIVWNYLYTVTHNNTEDNPTTNDEQWFVDLTACMGNVSLELLFGADALMLLLLSKSVRNTFFKFIFIDKLMKHIRRHKRTNSQVQNVQFQSKAQAITVIS